MVIFGTGIFVFMLSLLFCCYFIRWVADLGQAGREKEARGGGSQVRLPQQSPWLPTGAPALRSGLSLPFAGPLRAAVSIFISLSSCPRAYKVTIGWAVSHLLAGYPAVA